MNGKKEEESDIFKLVKMIMQRNFDPVSITNPLFSKLTRRAVQPG